MKDMRITAGRLENNRDIIGRPFYFHMWLSSSKAGIESIHPTETSNRRVRSLNWNKKQNTLDIEKVIKIQKKDISEINLGMEKIKFTLLAL